MCSSCLSQRTNGQKLAAVPLRQTWTKKQPDNTKEIAGNVTCNEQPLTNVNFVVALHFVHSWHSVALDLGGWVRVALISNGKEPLASTTTTSLL